jgi:hypothetical protein
MEVQGRRRNILAAPVLTANEMGRFGKSTLQPGHWVAALGTRSSMIPFRLWPVPIVDRATIAGYRRGRLGYVCSVLCRV